MRRICPVIPMMFSLCLTACAASLSVVSGAKVSGDMNHVMVSNDADAVESLALAVAYCSSYHRSARTSGHRGNEAVYDCVATD
jgi:hypothetical protein